MSTAYRKFENAFFETLFWSESCVDEDGNDPCGWGNFEWATVEDDLTASDTAEIKEDLRAFWGEFVRLVGGSIAKRLAGNAGHDFCLTINGHGAGFWDGAWPTYGDKLTILCRSYPNIHLMYQGENTPLYMHH
jgi:hypothetical protein